MQDCGVTGAGVAQSVQRLFTGWTVRGSNPGRGEDSAPLQTGCEAHPTSYTVGTKSFLGVKRPGRDVDHPSPSSAEVKERVLTLWAFVVCSRVNFTFTFVVWLLETLRMRSFKRCLSVRSPNQNLACTSPIRHNGRQLLPQSVKKLHTCTNGTEYKMPLRLLSHDILVDKHFSDKWKFEIILFPY